MGVVVIILGVVLIPGVVVKESFWGVRKILSFEIKASWPEKKIRPH